jgi:hypothetical protein
MKTGQLYSVHVDVKLETAGIHIIEGELSLPNPVFFLLIARFVWG